MKSILKLTVAASVAMLLATGCSKSDGSSTSEVTPPPDTKISGKLVDGYLAGSLVFADCNHDQTFQSTGEPSIITNADGDFALSIPVSCPNATLIASGGTNVDTGLPFSGVLMAPAGSKNITPLTTLVTVDPTFAAKIAEYGVSPDIDFAETNVSIPADLLIISQQVATAINVVSFNTKLADTKTIIKSIVAPLVVSIASVDLNDSNATAHTLASTASTSFDAIAAANDDITLESNSTQVITSSLSRTLTTITKEITAQVDENGTVTLTDVNTTEIANAVKDNNTDIETAVKLPVVHIDGFIINGGPLITSPNGNVYVTTTTEAAIQTTFTAVVDVTDAADRNYTVELSMAVGDVNSQRSANFVISNIVMRTAMATNTLIIDPSQVLTATITGTDGNGNLFTAVQLTDGTLGDIFTSDGTNLEINMATLLSKLQTTAGANHPLGDFFIPGTYGVTVVANGDIPMQFANYNLKLTISE